MLSNETPENAASSHLAWIQVDNLNLPGGEYSVVLYNTFTAYQYGDCGFSPPTRSMSFTAVLGEVKLHQRSLYEILVLSNVRCDGVCAVCSACDATACRVEADPAAGVRKFMEDCLR